MQKCPVCKENVECVPRYPRYVCEDCQQKHPPVNSDGKEVEYFNLGFGGGVGSCLKGEQPTDPPQSEHICFINGVKCWADEARFGGIVIEVMDSEPEDGDNGEQG
jgi:hypothetical protein